MDNTNKRAGWTVSGSQCVLTIELVEQLQRALDDLEHARHMGHLLSEERALAELAQIINEEMGQPATRAAG